MKMSRPILTSTYPVFFLSVVATLTLGQDTSQSHHERHEGLHQNSEAYISMLDSPERAAYQKPDEVVAALELRGGETVADIGAGSGYFTFRFSSEVGENGLVYAVDVNPDMIRFIHNRIQNEAVLNVRTVLAEPSHPSLPEGSIDRIFICNTWHHIGDQAHYLEVLKRVLKPRGQLTMIDYKKEELPVGPPPQMKIRRDDLIRQLGKAGYQLVNEHTFLPYQYFLTFEVQN
jgi:ubiquinone/menaquinone biosynthesis C-methylase UbiE